MGEFRDLTACAPVVENGCRLRLGDTILALHAIRKTAQTLMEYLSGIATATDTVVAAAHQGNPQCAVVCTRKNLPGTRLAAAGSVNASNAADYARAGCRILVASAPYFAGPRDVAVTLHAL